jgi:D-lyxose ketol-isomerase
MNEGDILDMGKRLMEEHQELEKKRKELEKTMLSFKKHLSIVYTFARELDDIIEADGGTPTIVVYMIQRIRSILSSMLFPDDEEEGQIDFGLYL